MESDPVNARVPEQVQKQPEFQSEPVPDWKRPAMVGYLVIILTFGVLGGWSAIARLDSAVVAGGVVAIESSRKVIQHFEGGIVRQVLVREGQHVKEGDLLFKLDETQSQANLDLTRNQLHSMQAQEARLMAERDGKDEVSFPKELISNSSQSVVKDAIADQQKQFHERRASLEGQIAIIGSRVKQYETEIDGITVEKAATTRQLEFIESELIDLRSLLEKNLVQKTRVLSLEREKSRLEGVIGRSTADIAKAHNGIAESRLNIEQTRKKFAEEVNAQILEVRAKIADVQEKGKVTLDVLQRAEIRSPRTGTIQNVRVATIGGVVRASEAIAEIIPDDEGMIINAQISPNDIDVISPGMLAEVRFSGFHGQILPVIVGRVETVSRDRMADEQSKQPYFLGRVVVDEQSVPAEVKDKITAGMQTEVIIPTGERTVISYLVRPLRNRTSTALRER
jgi:HlyD family type I secretion membrane fusion protein